MSTIRSIGILKSKTMLQQTRKTKINKRLTVFLWSNISHSLGTDADRRIKMCPKTINLFLFCASTNEKLKVEVIWLQMAVWYSESDLPAPPPPKGAHASVTASHFHSFQTPISVSGVFWKTFTCLLNFHIYEIEIYMFTKWIVEAKTFLIVLLVIIYYINMNFLIKFCSFYEKITLIFPKNWPNLISEIYNWNISYGHHIFPWLKVPAIFLILQAERTKLFLNMGKKFYRKNIRNKNKIFELIFIFCRFFFSCIKK